MYAYEELASEYPHLTINFPLPKNMPDNLAGLNIDTDVYLNRAISDIKMYEILQEEIATLQIFCRLFQQRDECRG